MDQRKQQVEQIIDEGQGSRRSVIVQMSANERAHERLIRVAADVHQRRNLSLSARELLPASQNKLEELKQVAEQRRTSASTRQTLGANAASLAVQVGAAMAPLAIDLLKSSSLSYLAPLLSHDIVQKALDEALQAKHKKQKKSEKPFTQREAPQLWTSRSVVLDISKDDLARLPDEVPQIRDIYPNRTLKLPPLAEVKDVPQRVQEEKAGAWGLNKIGALAAWGAYGARGKGVRVAVLDTGVDATHPDLEGRVSAWAEFDADGFEVPGSQPHDTDQHGTHCAGTIAGRNASGQWIGVAPEAEIAGCLVLDGRRGGTDAQVLAGIEWAIEQRVDVISMSLGGLTLDVEAPDPYTEALLSALAAGIPVITAIGNEGSQTTGSPGNDWFAFSVGATDPIDRPAGFSGGRTHIIRQSKFFDPELLPLVYSKPEVSAPGVAVRSSVPGGKWATFNGTSMATPHVSGAIALLLSATAIRDRVSEAQRAFLIEDLLTGSVEELGEAGQDHRYGFGRIDVLRAIGFAKERGY